MGNCINCQAYFALKSHCHRYPKIEVKDPDDWCMEFKAKEVIVNAVEEREVKESSVSEYQGADALGATTEAGDSNSDGQGREVKKEETIKKRGWPLGKPRK
jgi:hypothetical protein